MNGKEALECLQKADVMQLPTADVKTDRACQPRDPEILAMRYRTREKNASDEFTATLRKTLEAAATVELEPVLVATIGSRYVVVDGHHRLHAYQLAKRDTIPARVCALTKHEAVVASKLANNTPRCRQMHSEQRSEACWQYLADVTEAGTKVDAVGSLRAVASDFGIGRTTVRSMMRHLPKTNIRDFQAPACDPGTHFPRWRMVRGCGAGWRDLQQEMTLDQKDQRQIEKVSARIAGMLDALTPKVRRGVVEALKAEGRIDAAEAAESIAGLAEPQNSEDWDDGAEF